MVASFKKTERRRLKATVSVRFVYDVGRRFRYLFNAGRRFAMQGREQMVCVSVCVYSYEIDFKMLSFQSFIR